MEVMEDQAPVADLPAGVEDIDEQDAYNTQMATEYVTEIYSYMRELEVRRGPRRGSVVSLWWCRMSRLCVKRNGRLTLSFASKFFSASFSIL